MGSDTCEGGLEDSNVFYKPNTSAICPLVAPSHMLLLANVTVVATGKPVHFHLSQTRVSLREHGGCISTLLDGREIFSVITYAFQISPTFFFFLLWTHYHFACLGGLLVGWPLDALVGWWRAS